MQRSLFTYCASKSGCLRHIQETHKQPKRSASQAGTHLDGAPVAVAAVAPQHVIVRRLASSAVTTIATLATITTAIPAAAAVRATAGIAVGPAGPAAAASVSTPAAAGSGAAAVFIVPAAGSVVIAGRRAAARGGGAPPLGPTGRRQITAVLVATVPEACI